MKFCLDLRTATTSLAILAVIVCHGASGQMAQNPASGAMVRARVVKSMPPRAAPTDYLSHGQAGAITIAAEFDENSVPAPEATYTTENYVTVEVGIYGPPGTHLVLSHSDFSLRLNGKKAALPAQPYELLFKSLKDPSWSPPVQDEPKESKSGINTGGGGGRGNEDLPPPVIHMPPELQRAMEQNVQNASFPDGERVLPQAGLLHFDYGGVASKLRSVELLYAGPAGKATIVLK